jgi:hypothetical protein
MSILLLKMHKRGLKKELNLNEGKLITGRGKGCPQSGEVL